MSDNSEHGIFGEYYISADGENLKVCVTRALNKEWGSHKFFVPNT